MCPKKTLYGRYIESFLSDHFKSDFETYEFKINTYLYDEKTEIEKLSKLRSLTFIQTSDLTLRHIINNGFLCFNDEIVDYLYSLYKLNRKTSFLNIFLCDFLLNYERSIISNEYSKNVCEHKYKYFYSKFDKKLFHNFGLIEKRSLLFYKKVIDYIEKNDVFISRNVLLVLIKRLDMHLEFKNKLFEILLNQRKYLEIIYPNLAYSDKYKDTFINYAIGNFGFGYVEDSAFTLFMSMLKNKDIDELSFNKIVNCFVLEINNLVESSFENDRFSSLFYNIDIILRRLNIVLSLKSNKFETGYKKLIECRKSLMFFKRKMLQDEEILNNSMHSIKYEFKVDGRIRKSFDSLKNNVALLYSFIGINFKESIINAIKIYSKHPIMYNISSYQLDTNNQIYKKNDFESNSKISKYYIEFGKKYIEENSGILLNIPSGNLYSLLINYENSSYSQSISFISKVIENEYPEILDLINDRFGLKVENSIYVNILFIMLKCQNIIYELSKLTKKNSEFLDESKFIDEMFEMESDDFKKNGLAFVYYQLFEQDGPKIRNQYAHGNALTYKNHLSNMLIFLACLEFLEFYLDEYGR